MPLLEIRTNVKKQNIPGDFLQTASKTFQETIDKPMQYIAVIVRPDEMMSFGGSTEPCAMVDFISAGKIGGEENKNYSKAIAALMEKLGVPSDRMYIIFTDLARDNVGYKGSTMAAIF
ncbi:macrophage migration inhibitory factor-like [Asterias amurensis]|uniref:macrophage migration inhibitory factor-like n=1 Tax=Asterias amurensis TaxID=7602 RepID=UPI003AB685BA